ncbi:MAG: YitT family protein [Clostridia bacterium]|nr:YitT family protein [Clostridia bacterium]
MKHLKSYIIIFTGMTLTSLAIGLFYIPNGIVTGGVSGIATILYPIGVPPGITYAVVNLFLLFFSYKRLGRDFVIKSILSVIVISSLVQVFSELPPITENIFLATLFGSLLFGIGASLTFIENANTGGTDIIGRLVQSKYQYFPIGTLLMIIDGFIIFVSLIIFQNIDLALYGLFGLFISAFSIDFIIDHLNSSKLAFVITDKGQEISNLIIKNSRRGVTILNARGAYSGERKNLLICALKNKQIPDFHRMITETDESAFIIFTNSEKIFGLGFYVYK